MTEESNFLKRDYIIITILTLVYGAFALTNLGSMKAPQSYWSPYLTGESFYVDLGSPQNIAKIGYFLGLGKGSYKLEFSQDAQTWHTDKTIEQKNIYEYIGWRFLNIDVFARFVKITCQKPGAMLNEIGLLGPNDIRPIPGKSITVIYTSPDSTSTSNPQKVFDEQTTVAHIPSFTNITYFDEVYYARTAYENLHGIEPTETTHPPLGKLIISLGIAIFGMTPFGWRIMCALFGIAMVPAVYLFAKRVFKKTTYAFMASFLFSFDFMHFFHTRICMIDVFAVFFIILMYYCIYRYLEMDPLQTGPKKKFLALFLSGVFFGLGAACKWTALYGGLGLVIIIFISLTQHFLQYRKNKAPVKNNKTGELVVRSFSRYAALTLLWCVLAFIVIPAIIYILAYVPFMMLPGAGHELQDVFTYQKNMYDYHSNLQDTHPFSSKWQQWLAVRRPVLCYTNTEGLSADKVSSIVAMGNPAIWWLGPLALVFALDAAIHRKDRQMYVILIAFASQYLPWALVPRKLLFIHHFFPTMPFLVMCITYVFKNLNEKYSKSVMFTWTYMAIVLALFIMFYPILSGVPVDKHFVQTYLKWFDSWVFFN